MHTSDVFLLHTFPRRLMRSLGFFALAGTVMAAAVASDATVPVAMPIVMALTAWAIPALFALQVKRHGYDPLVSLTFTDTELVASYRDGTTRRLDWGGVRSLVRVAGNRLNGRAVVHATEPAIRWFGEMQDEAGLEARLAEQTGYAWESAVAMPTDPAMS